MYIISKLSVFYLLKASLFALINMVNKIYKIENKLEMDKKDEAKEK